MSVQGTSALRTQTKIVKKKTLMGTQTCTRQLVLDQHNKSQSHHGLLKLHLVSKSLVKTYAKEKQNHCRARWKRNACYGNAWFGMQATSKLSFNSQTSLPFLETDDRKRFPCL